MLCFTSTSDSMAPITWWCFNSLVHHSPFLVFSYFFLSVILERSVTFVNFKCVEQEKKCKNKVSQISSLKVYICNTFSHKSSNDLCILSFFCFSLQLRPFTSIITDWPICVHLTYLLVASIEIAESLQNRPSIILTRIMF